MVKNIKKIIFLVLLAFGCCWILIGCSNQAGNTDIAASGEKTSNVAENDAALVQSAENVLIGTINGAEYYDIDPQIQVKRYAMQGAEWTAEELASQMLEQEVLYQKALAEGVTLPDEEVREYISTLRDNMALDEQGQALFRELCSEYGWTEDEYWDKSFETYKRGMIIGKYRQNLENIIMSDLKGGNMPDEDMTEALEKSYKKELEKIYKEYNVKLLYGK